MTKALPMTLPADFTWIEAREEDDWAGARLELDGCAVVEVRPCRSGWLVTPVLPDPANPQPNVAVRSVAAGMRWSARWARERIPRLRVLVAQHRGSATPPASAPTPERHPPTAPLYAQLRVCEAIDA